MESVFLAVPLRHGPARNGFDMKPHVLILYTGGTIGMEAAREGLRPMAQFGKLLKQRLREQDCLSCMPDYDIASFDHPLDSADLTTQHWVKIAARLAHHWESYDGFVVLHGTDTMARTASALSFLLRGADKPVILTGAQVPMAASGSDAWDNLRMALVLSADPRIREVGICFGGHFLRGNRASKIAASRFDAFASFNYPALAKAEKGRVSVQAEHLLKPQKKAFAIPAAMDAQAVAVLTVYPGISSAMVDAVLFQPCVRALVVESYGVGNMPRLNGRFLAAMQEAVLRGVVLVNITQCRIGSVVQSTYASGAAFARIGIVPGGDITREACHAKLHLLVAQGLSPEEIHKQVGLPYSGEITLRTSAP